MFGLIVAVGSAARRIDERGLSACWPVRAAAEVSSPHPAVRIARFGPVGAPARCGFAWSANRRVLVCVDGYLYTDNAERTAPRGLQATAFADTCERHGYEAAIRSIRGGAFNLAAVDLSRGVCHVTTDHVGTLPLYHSGVHSGWLLSSNPVALARTGIIDRSPDMTAMAEVAYVGYTIGDRYMLKGIKIVPPFTSFHWHLEDAEGSFGENAGSPWRLVATYPGPEPEALADAMIESCRRIELLDPVPAHLLSAGKDSRFILACWPTGYDPACYTHGDEDSHEVSIARAIAELRGSRWVHVWLDGDEVSDSLDELFSLTGLIVYPDRLLAARRMSADGFAGVLDGYFGSIFQGGAYLECDRYFSLIPRMARFLTLYLDQRVSRIGKDRIAEAILKSILEVRDDAVLRQFLGGDFVSEMTKQRDGLLEDIRGQVERYAPENDSLSTLWNHFLLANRGTHAIAQQMAIMRLCLDVYCPFSSDVEYLRMQWRIPPESAAYKGLFLEMYRRRFPEYGKIPYADSLIPLNRPRLLHKWSAILVSKDLFVPYLTGNAKGKERDANSWNKWLRQSRMMRETALAFLREGGILDETSGARTMEEIGEGTRRGSGKIFHLASVSKWLALSGGNAS